MTLRRGRVIPFIAKIEFSLRSGEAWRDGTAISTGVNRRGARGLKYFAGFDFFHGGGKRERSRKREVIGALVAAIDLFGDLHERIPLTRYHSKPEQLRREPIIPRVSFTITR